MIKKAMSFSEKEMILWSLYRWKVPMQKASARFTSFSVSSHTAFLFFVLILFL